MKPVRYLLLAVLFGSLSLTACDSGNEKDEDTEVAEEITMAVTETVVAASAPVVQETNNIVATSFQAVVGANVAVSTAAGSVTQAAVATTSASGAVTTTTTTIAPLVNTVTGQPTGQVAIVTQSGSTTTTQVAGLTSSNPAAPTLGVSSQDGTQTSFPFNASFSAQPAAVVQGNNTTDKANVAVYNKAVSSDPNLTTNYKFSNGESAAQRFAAALAAPGKQAGAAQVVAAIAGWVGVLTGQDRAAIARADAACRQGGSSTRTSTITYGRGGQTKILVYTCATGATTLN